MRAFESPRGYLAQPRFGGALLVPGPVRRGAERPRRAGPDTQNHTHAGGEVALAEKNKNQTAQERARMKEALAAVPTNHLCAASACGRRDQFITHGELVSLVIAYPRRRTVFYHKACAPKLV